LFRQEKNEKKPKPGPYEMPMKHSFSFMVKAIALFTSVATALLVLAYHLWPLDWLMTCAISFGTTAFHFVMRLAVGYTLPALTHYDFDYNRPWFRPRKWEAPFYKKLKLHSWKGQLPTYAPEQFDLASIPLHRIIQNMCGAEIVHEIIMVLSFLPLLLIPIFGTPGVFILTSLGAAAFDSVFVMAQRYNRPRVVRIYERQEARRH